MSEQQLKDIIKNVSVITYQLGDINRNKGLKIDNSDLNFAFHICKLVNLNFLDAMKRMNENLEKYKNSIEIPDEVYDSIFFVQDNINDEIKPKLFRIQSYGDISIKPTDALKSKSS